LEHGRDAFFPGSGTVVPLNFHEDFHSRWLATFRGRLGWVVNPILLIYGTGGLAVAQVGTTDSVVASSTSFNTVSASTTRTGWTVGGGVEWMFVPRWSVKAEYLYVDLGSFSTTSVLSTDPRGTIVHDHHLTENIARVGLNYHF
jgi:outer membrane immunogenic protein